MVSLDTEILDKIRGGEGSEGGISPNMGRKFLLACCCNVKLNIKVLKLQKGILSFWGYFAVHSLGWHPSLLPKNVSTFLHLVQSLPWLGLQVYSCTDVIPD